MKEIAVGDGLEISESAYTLLAQLAEGSMRDGLSILERCVSACGNKLSYDDVVSVMGISGNELNYKLIDAIKDQDTVGVLKIINSLMEEGKDLNVFMDFLISYVRDLMVLKVTENPERILDLSAEDIVKMKAQAEKMSFENINNAITVLSKAKADAKYEKSPRVIYELSLVKLTRPELDDSNSAVISRLSDIEDKIKNGMPQTVVIEKTAEPEPEETKKKEVSKRLYLPLDKEKLTAKTPVVMAARRWDKICTAIIKKCPFVTTSILNRKITIDGEGIIILFEKNEMMKKKILTTYIKQVQDIFQKQSGTDLLIKAAYEEDIGDNLIDFWDLPEGEKPEAEPEETVGYDNSTDPLIEIGNKFPEIVEYTDESEFIEYEGGEDFSQEAFDETDSEEFLDEKELAQDEE